MNHNIKIIIICLFCFQLSGCFIYNDVEGSENIQIGMPYKGFSDLLDDNGITEIQEIDLNGKDMSDYKMLSGINLASNLNPTLFYYLFEHNQLVYFDQAQRFVVHDNPDFREAAKQAFLQIDKYLLVKQY